MLENTWALEPGEVARELSSSLQRLSNWLVRGVASNRTRDRSCCPHAPAFLRRLPGTALLWLTVALVVVTLLLPYLSFARVFGFVPVPGTMMALLIGIVIAYVFSAELLKRWFYRV
jgi:hypothetical protein